MCEELLADSESLEAGEVVVVPGRELVMTRSLLLRELFVPALHKTPSNALNPLVDFMCFSPRAPTIGSTRDTILAQREFGLDPNIDGLICSNAVSEGDSVLV